MKVAYILDASTKRTSKVKNNKDVYTLPFKTYNESGVLVNEYDPRQIAVLQSVTDEKTYVEPTPGVYRDFYNNLIKNGYDYIVCIPQSNQLSVSYKNAEYAVRTSKAEVMMIDVTKYNLTPDKIVEKIVSYNKFKVIDLTGFIQQVLDVLDQFQTKLVPTI